MGIITQILTDSQGNIELYALILILLVANLADTKLCQKNTEKMIVTMALGYLSVCT